MKSANRDINVVEWANIPNVSALKEFSDSFQTSRIILYDVLVDMILSYNKLHNRESRHFCITNEKIRYF